MKALELLVQRTTFTVKAKKKAKSEYLRDEFVNAQTWIKAFAYIHSFNWYAL